MISSLSVAMLILMVEEGANRGGKISTDWLPRCSRLCCAASGRARNLDMTQYHYVKTRREDVQEIKESQVPTIRFFMRWATRICACPR